MDKDLLELTCDLKGVIQNTDFENLELLNCVCREIGRQCSSNVLLVNKAGKVLSNVLLDENESLINIRQSKGHNYIDAQLNEQLKLVYEAKINTGLNSYYIKNATKEEVKKAVAAIFPTIAVGKRNGTMILYKTEGEFTLDNTIIAEFCSAALSLIIAYTQNEELVEESRKSETVKSALGTLSYSELEAVVHIFQELNGMEGLLVASKIADKVGITRSVIVNALRKLESAGVIESRSLGMKGTYIKVINSYLVDEMKNYRS